METGQVKFLGITFRSKSHCTHFVGSMHFFAVYVATVALSLFEPQAPQGAVTVLFFVFFAIHLLIFMVALWQTDYGRKNGPVYSKDCIWFNAAMAGIYIVFTITAIIAREFFFT